MKKFMNLSLILTVALSASSLVGCAFGNSSDEQTKQELDNREKLLQSFSRVIGSYEGELLTNGRTIKIIASISSVDEENGKNSNGETKFIPVLKLRYRQMDTVRPDIIMNARYIQENGTLNAAETTSKGSDGKPVATGSGTSISGTMNGETYSGTIRRNAGILGKFELERKSLVPSSPIEDPMVDYQNRLREQFEEISGTYDGTMDSYTTGKPTTIRLVLKTYEQHVNGVTYVILGAVLIDPVSGLNFGDMTASYQLETTPAKLLIGSQKWSATGVLEDGVYTASIKSDYGTSKMVVTKK